MPNITDLDAQLTSFETDQAAFITAVAAYITSVNTMITRALAHIAAGVDTAAEITRLQTLGGNINNALSQVTSAKAQADSEFTP